MKPDRIQFTCRMPRRVVQEIDMKCNQLSFPTRAKFLAAAANAYSQGAYDDALLQRLAAVALAMQRLASRDMISAGMKAEMRREVRSAMRAVRASL